MTPSLLEPHPVALTNRANEYDSSGLIKFSEVGANDSRQDFPAPKKNPKNTPKTLQKYPPKKKSRGTRAYVADYPGRVRKIIQSREE